MPSINIFLSLVLPTQLLSKVKGSHQIDFAYLYHLPFCAVLSSWDNFHVQVAPLFMNPAQQFVRGDDLKVDLKRLDDLYLQLPPETFERGLYTFAQFPPGDSSFLTNRLWDAYLPDWRKSSKNVAKVPQEIKDAHSINPEIRASACCRDICARALRRIRLCSSFETNQTAEERLFRIAKDVALKSHEEEHNQDSRFTTPAQRFLFARKGFYG